MSANVVALTQFVHLDETSPEIIARLEELLEKAKRGEVKGIALAWVSPGSRVSIVINQGSAAACEIVAATSRLNWVANKWWDDFSDDGVTA
jgi:hypothetical protein